MSDGTDEKMNDDVVFIERLKSRSDSDGENRDTVKIEYSPRVLLEKHGCLKYVDEMIRSGLYTRKIAENLFGAGIEIGKSVDEITLIIRSYRDSIELAESSNSGIMKKGGLDKDSPLYELAVLREMFDDHRTRITMEVETEKNLRKLFSGTHKEIEVLQHLGVEILKLKKEFGLIDQDGGSTTGGGSARSMGETGRMDMASVMMNAESRQKVLGAVETIFGDFNLLKDIKEAGGFDGMMKMIVRDEVPPDELSVSEALQKRVAELREAKKAPAMTESEEKEEESILSTQKKKTSNKKTTSKKKTTKKKTTKKKTTKKKPAKKSPAKKRAKKPGTSKKKR